MHVCTWREQPQDLSLETLLNFLRITFILSVLMFLPVYMSVPNMGGCSSQKYQKTPNSWEPPCGCWGLKLGPLKSSSLGQPATCCVAHAGFEPTKVCLPLPPECQDQKCEPNFLSTSSRGGSLTGIERPTNKLDWPAHKSQATSRVCLPSPRVTSTLSPGPAVLHEFSKLDEGPWTCKANLH